MSEYRDTLRLELLDREYRYAYSEDFLNTYIATQLKVLREQRGLTQGALAEIIGSKQPGIARLENVNYSAWRTETLRKLARALDVRLRITFEPFSTLVEDARAFSRQNLERPRFEEDPMFKGLDKIAEIDKHVALQPLRQTAGPDMAIGSALPNAAPAALGNPA
jgi:transcriptional regulator with XRE-family HTH domain